MKPVEPQAEHERCCEGGDQRCCEQRGEKKKGTRRKGREDAGVRPAEPQVEHERCRAGGDQRSC